MRSQHNTIETIEGVGIPKRRKRTIFCLMLVMIIGIYSGLWVGNYIIGLRSDPNRYNFDASALKDDVAPIRASAVGKTPITLGAVKSCVLAFDTTFNAERVQVVGKGSVNAMGIVQSIQAKTIRNGSNLFSESVSLSSMVTALNRTYVSNNTISQFKGEKKGNKVVWNTKDVATDDLRTMEQFVEQFGVPINYYMTYLVSSKTVIDASAVTQNGEDYEFTLTLDKQKSVIYYVKSMKATGGLSDYPDFLEDPVIKLVIDKDYRIKKFESSERYSVKMGVIKVESRGTLCNTFTYDQDFKIPDLSEDTIIE